MLLFKSVLVVSPGNPLNGQRVDLLVANGKIEFIDKDFDESRLPVTSKIIEIEGLSVSPGWLDTFCQVGEPGLEHRETFSTASSAAALGGFTGIFVLPNTRPALDSKSEVQFVQSATTGHTIDFYPMGAITKGCEGKDFAEMYDLRQSGAVAFTDGKLPIADSGLMLRALEYVKPISGIIVHQSYDPNLAKGSQMHEGEVSTLLGMRGMPAMAEELFVARDIELVKYADSKIHFANISTKGAVDLVRKAKAAGLQVTASACPLNLCFSDKSVADFENNFKVMPPLRAEEDMAALWEGLKDGTIDCINSNHIPLEIEQKECEFTYAGFGAINLETTFALLRTHNQGLTLGQLVEKLSINPRKIFDIAIPELRPGAVANLTFFLPDEEWIFTKEDIRSKSKNSPIVGHSLKGKVLGVLNNGRWIGRKGEI